MSDESSPRGIDTARVSEWVEAHVTGARAPFVFRLIAAGGSNLTYLLEDARGVRRILRRPPSSAALATAHDMHREWRIMSALGAHQDRGAGAADDGFLRRFVSDRRTVLRDGIRGRADTARSRRRRAHGCRRLRSRDALAGRDPGGIAYPRSGGDRARRSRPSRWLCRTPARALAPPGGVLRDP